MPDLREEALASYLESLLGSPVKIVGLAPLDEPIQTDALKEYG